MSKNIEGVGEVATPSTFKEKLQNFIYHYKWHTVVALFLVVTIIICSLQFCTKEEYDALMEPYSEYFNSGNDVTKNAGFELHWLMYGEVDK